MRINMEYIITAIEIPTTIIDNKNMIRGHKAINFKWISGFPLITDKPLKLIINLEY